MASASALVARDKIGVEDFVLLEDYKSEDAFIENLRKRFKEKLIYVREKERENRKGEQREREREWSDVSSDVFKVTGVNYLW